MNLEVLTGIIGIVAASSTALSLIFRAIGASLEWRAERQSLQSIRVERVVSEPSLDSLGSVIMQDLGGTSISNYVRRADVRTSFRRAFNAARDFIGDSVEPESLQPTDRPDDAHYASARNNERNVWIEESLTPVGEKALKDVAEGEPWNALARMRRQLELSLASRLDLQNVKRRMAVGQLLAVATKQGVVPVEIAQDLRYPISVANRAIHGEDVPPDVAVEAIVLIDRFIRVLRSSPEADGPSSVI